jgi:hypothetical protein
MEKELSKFIEVPTYRNGQWSSTAFNTREEFRDFLLLLFKEPGEYNFDDASFIFNAEGRKFQKQGYYCAAPVKTKDFINYWDDQKHKCRNGIIVHGTTNTWYLSRDYYMWLNFLPIYDKEEKRFDFAKVRDAQYHMALYEILGELHYKHAIILKKRQIASSYFHMAKLLNQYWFEEGAVLKIGASLKDYINEKGSWKFLDEYKNFLNEHTAWYRPAEPDKVGVWRQQIKVRINNRDTYRGLKSSINSYSFEKDPTNGVGGPVTYFFHEEGGIAPKMNDTYGFIKPALKSGHLITGQFIAAGSVGDLDQCEPLKDYIYHPEENGFFSVESNLLDGDGTIGKTGLFIPEQWSMPPYIDQYGNSKVEEALAALEIDFARMKKEMDPAAFQLTISQQPRNIEEAFATRKVSVFPPHLVSKQLQRISDKTYSVEYLELTRNAEGKIVDKASNKLPIMEFPISKKTEDKEGVICIYERPHKDPQFGMYYASVDPVSEGKTTTSDSLCSIYVYKTAVEVIKKDGENLSHTIERDGIVASWCGRFDDIKKTHERLEILIEWYNAWTLVENNVSLFIHYMMERKKQRYLVPKSMMLFLKDIGANANVFQEYGWRNVGTLFKGTILSYGIEFLKEELDQEVLPDGTIVKTVYGVERIPDPMLLKEMAAYRDGLNVDRIVSFCALVAFVKVQQANRGMSNRVEVTKDNLDTSQKFSKLNWSPFRHMGTSKRGPGNNQPSRNPFKNIR